MCTLYHLGLPAQETAHIFRADLRDAWEPPLSVYPDRPAPVVGHGRQGRVVANALWGVPPPVAGARPVVNIRNLDSSFWRAGLSRPALRCLVPATSFCEWTDAPDPATGRKRQLFFALTDNQPFAFAGLIYMGRAGAQDSARFAFLTCEPNGVVAPIHAKAMPVILLESQWDGWMDGVDARAFQMPLPDDRLQIIA